MAEPESQVAQEPVAPKKKSRKLHKYLGLVGAGIIVATFIAKDVLREGVKDTLSARTAAGIEFQSLIFHDDEMTAIQRGPLNPRLLSATEAAGITARSTKAAVASFAQPFLLDEFGDVVAHADVLTDALPPGCGELLNLRERTKASVAELDAARTRVSDAFDRDSAQNSRERATVEQREAAQALSSQYGKTDDLVRQYMQKSIEAAQQEDAKQQDRYDAFTRISFALYGAGAIITIWGKAVEDDEVEGVEA